MARNVATFVVDVVSKGLKQARDQVSGLGAGARQAAGEYGKANNAAGGFYNTQAKGVIGTANSTKSFSKLAETMNSGGGIVGAYATLAANIFAVTAAFNALRGAAQVQQLEQGLTAMGNRMGTTLSVAAENMREISGYTLSTEQALRSTANIASAGFGTKSMEDLAKVANDVSVALGRNMTDSMDRLTRGVVKLEPELLDELGLMTKIGESSANYARELNKTESQLSNFEKRQGFMNAIVAEGTAKFGGLADAAGESRNLDRLAATFSDLTKDILNFINNAALPLAGIFGSKGFLLAGMVLFGSTISKQLLPGLTNLQEKMAKTASSTRDMAQAQTLNLLNAVKDEKGAGGTPIRELPAIKTLRKEVEANKATLSSYSNALDAITAKEADYNKELERRTTSTTQAGARTKTLGKMTEEAINGELEVLQEQKKAIQETKITQAQAAAQTAGSNAISAAGNRKLLVSKYLLRDAVKQYSVALNQSAAAANGAGIANTKAAVMARTAWFAASVGVRAFGAALLTGLGAIGGLIAAASLLYGAYELLKGYFTSDATKKYNEALEEQVTILGQLKDRTSEINRISIQRISAAQREQATYKVMTNTIRENIEAYEKVKIAQDDILKENGKTSFTVGSTAEFKTLTDLQKFGGPEVKKQINEALGREGLTGILENAGKEIDKGKLEKLSKILREDLRQGAVTLGDHINDLAEAFKTADEAIADFNRSAIPSTPYDAVVKNLDSVANALNNITTNAANSDNFVERMAQTLTAAGPNVRSLFTVDTQKQLSEYDKLNTSIQAAGDKALQSEISRREELEVSLSLRTSEVFAVQELFAQAQRVARQTESAIALEQTRLNQLNKYTALTGSSIRDRRASENKILQLQASQLAAQSAITKRQIELTNQQIEMNKLLLEQDKIYQQIVSSIGLVGVASDENFHDEVKRRILLLRQEKDSSWTNTPFGRSTAQIDEEMKGLQGVIAKRQEINSQLAANRDRQDQINASSAQQASILGNQTSAAVVNAEANAQNAQTTAENTQKQLDYMTQLVKNAKILSDIEVKRRGYARSTAEEYNHMVKESALLSGRQKEAIANQANAEVQQLRVQQVTASANAAEVAAYQQRIDATINLANAKMVEIDRQAELNILEKFSFDIHKEGLEMQKSAIEGILKQVDAQNELVSLQREGRNLSAEIARRRGGRASNENSRRIEEINAAKEQLDLARQQASMRKAVITLEYALLEAQRQQMVWNLEAQQKILTNPEQKAQLQATIDTLKDGSAAVQAGLGAALYSVDENIRNLEKKYNLSGLKEGANFVGSGLKDLVSAQIKAAKAADSTPQAIDDALKTHISPLEKSNQALVSVQGGLTAATVDLTNQMRAASTAPIPQTATTGPGRTEGTLYQRLSSFKQWAEKTFPGVHGELDNHGGKTGDRRGIDFNYTKGGRVDWNDPQGRAILTTIAKAAVAAGLGTLWGNPGDEFNKRRVGGHLDHLHVDGKGSGAGAAAIPRAVVAPIKALTTSTDVLATNVASVATSADALAQTAANDNSETLGATINGRRKPKRGPRDIGSLTEQFNEITQVGDFNMLQVFESMADKLGPEGSIVTQIMTGMTMMGNSIANFQKVVNDPEADFADKFAAGASVMQNALGTIQGVLSAASDAKVAGIDREIAAEQKRDGKSAESVAKIQAMERRKDAIQRKAFNTNKKLMMAQAVIATAAGVAQALTLGPIVGPIMAAVIGALGAAQLAIISGTSYQSSANANFDQKSMPSTLTIGKRGDSVDLARHNPNVGGELGYLRGTNGRGTNSSNYAPIGSKYGGDLPRGYGHNAFVVGESGPEVMERDTPISVRPLENNNDNRPINATFQIQAFDGESVRQMLDDRKGDLIDMLRGAANANGSTFLEDVNTSHYKKANGSGRASRI